jgi:hypothetical protein
VLDRACSLLSDVAEFGLVGLEGSTTCAAVLHHTLRSADAVPTPGLTDLLTASWDQAGLRNFNAYLSSAALAALHKGILLWMQACSLRIRGGGGAQGGRKNKCDG